LNVSGAARVEPVYSGNRGEDEFPKRALYLEEWFRRSTQLRLRFHSKGSVLLNRYDLLISYVAIHGIV
jgi:hypothetical protein